MDDHIEIQDVTESSGRSQRLSQIVWPIFALLALLAFELTADAALACLVLSTKFGWQNALTAIWLRRRDPHRARGLACCWFELVIGAAKILFGTFALSTTIVAACVIWFANNKGVRVPAWVDQLLTAWFSGAFKVMGGAMIATALLGCAGCVYARRHRIKVWISPALHAARRADQWPPPVGDTTNLAGCAWFLSLMSSIYVIVYVAFNFIQRFQLSPNIFVPLFLPPCLFAVWLFRGIKLYNLARTPAECWSDR